KPRWQISFRLWFSRCGQELIEDGFDVGSAVLSNRLHQGGQQQDTGPGDFETTVGAQQLVEGAESPAFGRESQDMLCCRSGGRVNPWNLNDVQRRVKLFIPEDRIQGFNIDAGEVAAAGPMPRGDRTD